MHEHGPDGPAWAIALEASPVGQAMRESAWLYPAVELVHIIGFALLFGSIAAYDLRLIAGREPPEVAQRVAACGLAAAIPAGVLLFTTEASAYVHNTVFLAKLGLIALALANVALFHFGLSPSRFAGAASLGLWLGVLACGRLIAYL